MNDIPLIVCLPLAYAFGHMDSVNAAVGVMLTLLDLIFMIFYLSYDEELSIDAQKVYELTQKRLQSRQSHNDRLFDDLYLIEEAEALALSQNNHEHQMNVNSDLALQLDASIEQRDNINSENSKRNLILNSGN